MRLLAATSAALSGGGSVKVRFCSRYRSEHLHEHDSAVSQTAFCRDGLENTMVFAAVSNCRNSYSLCVAKGHHSDEPSGINSDLRSAQSAVLCPPALAGCFPAEGARPVATLHQPVGRTRATRCRKVQWSTSQTAMSERPGCHPAVFPLFDACDTGICARSYRLSFLDTVLRRHPADSSSRMVQRILHLLLSSYNSRLTAQIGQRRPAVLTAYDET